MSLHRILLYTFLLFSSISGFSQQTIKIGGWRMHLPYNSVYELVETPQLIYVRGEVGFYSFDKKSGSIEVYSKVNGFSETEVASMAYSEEYNALVIGYKNTNIDILKDGKIINFAGILRATIIGKKEINDIQIFGKTVFIATSFGFVEYDLEREEVIDDYINLDGPNTIELNSVVQYGDSVYFGSPKGIYVAAVSQKLKWKDPKTWNVFRQDSAGIKMLRIFNNKLYFVQDSKLRSYDRFTVTEVELGVKYGYQSVVINNGKLVVCKDSGITVYDQNGLYRQVNERFKYAAIYDHEDNIWTGGFYTGLMKISPGNQYGYIKPQGPFGSTSFEMEGYGDRMWITGGGHTTTYSPTFSNTGYYVFEKGSWTSRDLSVPELASMYDFTAIAINRNTDEVWLGSHGTGLVQLKNGKFVKRFDDANSELATYVNGWTICLGLALDQNENLWIANYESDDALLKLPKGGDGYDMVRFNVNMKRLGKMIIDDFDTKWILAERDNTVGIYCFREDEIDSRGFVDAKVTTVAGRGALPSNQVNAIVLDKDGEIWVGTETGVAVFYNPEYIFEGGTNADASLIKINDGNDIGYLLGNEVVNDIKIDGANRKWIATNNGVWLVSADGLNIIHHFTTANSPMPSNSVNCIGINPNSGEVFFGTNGGIISYRSDATEATDLHENTLIYPNPVHKGYEGPITITGLPEDATVKIADVAGRVVYELIATGGTAVWHGRNFAGELPKSGIYLIITANKEDEDAVVSKLLIVR